MDRGINEIWRNQYTGPLFRNFSISPNMPEVSAGYLSRQSRLAVDFCQQMMRPLNLNFYAVITPLAMPHGEKGFLHTKVIKGFGGAPLVLSSIALDRPVLGLTEEIPEKPIPKSTWLFHYCRQELQDGPVTQHFLGYAGGKWQVKAAPEVCEIPSQDEFGDDYIYWTGNTKEDVVVFSYTDYCFYGFEGKKIADISAFENDNRSWVLNACLVGGVLTVFSWDSVYTFSGDTDTRIRDQLRVDVDSINQSGTECFVRNFTQDNSYTLENLEVYSLASEGGAVTISLPQTLPCVVNEVDNPPTFPDLPVWWYPGEGTTKDYLKETSIYADVTYEADVLTYASEEIKEYTYLEQFGNEIISDNGLGDFVVAYKSKRTLDNYTKRTWPTWSYSHYQEVGFTDITQTDTYVDDELISSEVVNTYSDWTQWWIFSAGAIPSLGLEFVYKYTFIGSDIAWAGYQLNISVYRHGVSIYELPLKDWDPDALSVQMLRKAHNRKGQAVFAVRVNDDVYFFGYAEGEVTDISDLVGELSILQNEWGEDIPNIFNLAPIHAGLDESV